MTSNLSSMWKLGCAAAQHHNNWLCLSGGQACETVELQTVCQNVQNGQRAERSSTGCLPKAKVSGEASGIFICTFGAS